MTKKLNVCLLNDSFPPYIDGVSNTIVNYAKNIQNGKGNAIVVTPDFPGVKDEYDFKVYRYPSSGITKRLGYRMGLPYCPKTYTKLCRDGIDVIHSHCPVMSNMVARMLREITGAPMIFTYHTKFDIEIDKAIKIKPLRTEARQLMVENMETADEVWVVSNGAGENLRSLGFKGDYRVMPNGVDLPKGRMPDYAVRKLKAKHNIPEGIPVFMFVGRVTWYKGIRISLDGLKMLKSTGQKFKMVFVGSGLDLKDIQKYTEKIGLADDCIFAGPVYNRNLLRVYFTMADLFLFPSTFDTNGLVVREAAACGLPSVLIADSCASEGVTDGRNGFLIRENAESMASALITLSKDVPHLHEVGMCAMDEIYMSWEDSVDNAYRRYEQIYEETRDLDMRRNFTPQDEACQLLAKVYNNSRKLQRVQKPHQFSIKW